MDGRKRDKVLAIALAVVMTLAGIGSTVAVEQGTADHVVTGHTNFISASTSFNSCFAGVAGLLLQRVTWFNGQTLFQRSTDGGGGKWVYFTESFTDTSPNGGDGYDDATGIAINDPAKEKLFRTNNTYRLEDPEHPSKTWEVREYFALREKKGATVEAGDNEADAGDAREAKRVYVFAVKVGNTYDSDFLDGDYNFVSVVDTCRFHSSNATWERHTADGSGSGEEPRNQHNFSDENHTHDVYSIDIWVGGAPDSLPCVDTGQTKQQCVPDDRDSKDQNSTQDDVGDGSP